MRVRSVGPLPVRVDVPKTHLCGPRSIDVPRKIAGTGPLLIRLPGLPGVLWHIPPNSGNNRSEEHTSELQSLMRISYAVFCLKKKKQSNQSSQSPSMTPHNNYR